MVTQREREAGGRGARMAQVSAAQGGAGFRGGGSFSSERGFPFSEMGGKWT